MVKMNNGILPLMRVEIERILDFFNSKKQRKKKKKRSLSKSNSFNFDKINNGEIKSDSSFSIREEKKKNNKKINNKTEKKKKKTSKITKKNLTANEIQIQEISNNLLSKIESKINSIGKKKSSIIKIEESIIIDKNTLDLNDSIIFFFNNNKGSFFIFLFINRFYLQ